jgi:hypothetical protein
MTETCETCRFFSLPRPRRSSAQSASFGDCRRYPPAYRHGGNGHGSWGWPLLSKYSWCGEHRSSEERAAANGASAYEQLAST